MENTICEWRPINGFEGYEVSSLGEIRSCARTIVIERHGRTETRTYRGLVRRQSEIVGGYLEIILSVGNKQTHKLVHRLVADAFVDRPDGRNEVNHIDGVKSNNVVSNLEWVTRSENHIHRARVLKKSAGSSHYKARLTESDVEEIRRLVASGEKKSEVAKQFSVSPTHIARIVLGQSWAMQA